MREATVSQAMPLPCTARIAVDRASPSRRILRPTATIHIPRRAWNVPNARLATEEHRKAHDQVEEEDDVHRREHGSRAEGNPDPGGAVPDLVEDLVSEKAAPEEVLDPSAMNPEVLAPQGPQVEEVEDAQKVAEEVGGDPKEEHVVDVVVALGLVRAQAQYADLQFRLDGVLQEPDEEQPDDDGAVQLHLNGLQVAVDALAHLGAVLVELKRPCLPLRRLELLLHLFE
eukprot:UN5014